MRVLLFFALLAGESFSTKGMYELLPAGINCFGLTPKSLCKTLTIEVALLTDKSQLV